MKNFTKLVDIVKQDYYSKKLKKESFHKIMIFAQLYETAYMQLATLYWMKSFKKSLALNPLALLNYHERITN